MSKQSVPLFSEQSLQLILFGSTGDLAKQKLIPSLWVLFNDKELPDGLSVIAVTREPLDVINMLEDLKPLCPEADQSDRWAKFVALFQAVVLDITLEQTYDALLSVLCKEKTQVLYYAISPRLFGCLTETLGAKGAIKSNTRVVIEKPVGDDLESALVINKQLAQFFSQEQIFRMDHYLGKEAVQNLMALRFGNAIFEPLWRSTSIDSIQITIAESIGVGDRGGYYDHYGALRDMVQNHLLQLLCIITMEPPAELTADAIHFEKLKLLKSLCPIEASDVSQQTVRGRYVASSQSADELDYLEEKDVSEDSETETFVAIRAQINNWRWAGVPIFLRTGKSLKERRTEVVITFKDTPVHLFQSSGNQLYNRLVLTLQPAESIQLFVNAKASGKGIRLEPMSLNLDMASRSKARRWAAYERLLSDVLQNDSRLFLKQEEIHAAWSWIDPIISGWKQQMPRPESYRIGSWGPSASDQLLAKSGHIWHNEPVFD